MIDCERESLIFKQETDVSTQRAENDWLWQGIILKQKIDVSTQRAQSDWLWQIITNFETRNRRLKQCS